MIELHHCSIIYTSVAAAVMVIGVCVVALGMERARCIQRCSSSSSSRDKEDGLSVAAWHQFIIGRVCVFGVESCSNLPIAYIMKN